VLTWRDFEVLTLEMLHTFGYRTEMNVRFTKPRCEIDVIGIDSTRVLIIDCKYWKGSDISLISTYAKKQLQEQNCCSKEGENP
jgi:Holliday junction resolvase-like predicted endonuclease